jgi:hypothetical protein
MLKNTRKTLLNIIAGIAIATTFASCASLGYHKEYSPQKITTGKIRYKEVKDKQNLYLVNESDARSVSNPTYDSKVGKYMVTIPAQFKVYIDTPLEELIIDNQELYNKSKVGQEAKVIYRDIYKAKYKDKNPEGQKKLVERILTGYQIIEVRPQ